MLRPWNILIGAFGALVVGGALFAANKLAASPLLSRGRVEHAPYEVVERDGDLEIRRYAPRLVAEVEVEGDPEQATNAGFRLLADYIFGNNSRAESVAMTAPVDRRAASEKIAMTAPVDRQARGDRWIIAFTMPSKYTLETLPRPANPRVTIREAPAQRYAAVRFSGALREPEVRARIAAAEAAVAAAGLERAAGEAIYARYDPPWTPGFLRHNEVLIELRALAE